MKIKTFFYYTTNTDYSKLDDRVNEFIATLDEAPIDIKLAFFNGAMVYTVVYNK